MARRATSIAFFILQCGLVWSTHAVAAQEISCANHTTFDCGKLVRDLLIEKRTELLGNPERAYAIATEWDKVFRKAYLGLKNQPRSESDLEKIKKEVFDAINPIEWSKEKARDAVIRRYLPRLSPVMKFLSSAPVAALTAYLTPSEIASDLDELELANKEVQDALFPILMLNARSDWKSTLTESLGHIRPPGPEIRSAP